MTRLQFTIPQNDAVTRSDPAVPVNVHRAQDFAIVSRSVTGQDFPLDPGDYVAVVRFPDGSEAMQTFHLTDSEASTVELYEVAQVIAGQVEPDPVPAPRWTSSLPYDLIDFNPFLDKAEALAEGRSFAVQKDVSGPNGDQWRFLAVAPQGCAADDTPLADRTFLVALPTPERVRVTVTLALDERGVPRPDFVMPRVAATLLYRYLAKGAPEAAARLSSAAQLQALELVENKVMDPVSGALGLYLLLGIDRLEGIGDRSEKLCKYNPHLADGAIIRGEYLARQGRHDEAAAVLISIKERGVPVLTIGFRTALARIGTYIRAGLAAKPLSDVDQVLRYWAVRAAQNSPTTVIELDPGWSARVRRALGADT